ncbi:hypothetical protein [Acidovorax sp. Leaf84]|nr:hypothetical protein [Acidovorax sp. Leaf84]
MRSIIKSYFSLILLVMLLGCKSADEFTPKNFVSLSVAHTASLKIEIAKSLMASPGKSVPQAGRLQLDPPSGLASMKFDFGWVTSGGVIIIKNTKFAVILVQEPTIDREGVTWSCIVHPVEAKPTLCGSDYQNELLRSK